MNNNALVILFHTGSNNYLLLYIVQSGKATGDDQNGFGRQSDLCASLCWLQSFITNNHLNFRVDAASLRGGTEITKPSSCKNPDRVERFLSLPLKREYS